MRKNPLLALVTNPGEIVKRCATKQEALAAGKKLAAQGYRVKGKPVGGAWEVRANPYPTSGVCGPSNFEPLPKAVPPGPTEMELRAWASPIEGSDRHRVIARITDEDGVVWEQHEHRQPNTTAWRVWVRRKNPGAEYHRSRLIAARSARDANLGMADSANAQGLPERAGELADSAARQDIIATSEFDNMMESTRQGLEQKLAGQALAMRANSYDAPEVEFIEVPEGSRQQQALLEAGYKPVSRDGRYVKMKKNPGRAARLKRLIAKDYIRECPQCGKLSAFAWEDAEKYGVAHIGAASGLGEWECGHCHTHLVERDSPLLAECYTHVPPPERNPGYHVYALRGPATPDWSGEIKDLPYFSQSASLETLNARARRLGFRWKTDPNIFGGYWVDPSTRDGYFLDLVAGDSKLAEAGYKHNPGAAYHQRKADAARREYDKSGNEPEVQERLWGQITSHEESAVASRRMGINPGVHREMFERWLKYARLLLAEKLGLSPSAVKTPAMAWDLAHKLDIPREAYHVGLNDAHIETALRRIFPAAGWSARRNPGVDPVAGAYRAGDPARRKLEDRRRGKPVDGSKRFAGLYDAELRKRGHRKNPSAEEAAALAKIKGYEPWMLGNPKFVSALKRYIKFHGCWPTSISKRQIAGLGEAQGQDFFVNMGKAPDVSYIPGEDQKNSNKAGSAWLHEFNEGGDPKDMSKLPDRLCSGDGKTILTHGGKYIVDDWVRG